MKKILFICIVVAFLFPGLVFNAFCEQPRYGGVLRTIWASGPRVLSYLPEMGPPDEIAVLPASEKLMEFNQDGDLVPLLAESMTVGTDGKIITFKIKKGIKFHDGSDLNAEAAAFNYQLAKDTHRMQYDDRLLSIEVVDPYTLRLHITGYHNQLLTSFGWVPLYSKAAWDKAGGGDIEKSKQFARVNCVGTGPFKLAEFKRDVYLKWVKNENYWQKSKPYLDGIDVRYIPDPVTASAMMQAGEADWWRQPPIKFENELVKMGFVRKEGFGLPRILFINNKDPESKFKNKKLREAIEYALDKVAMAKALGFGHYKPLKLVAPPGVWGYDDDYKGREYNPEKAKLLLTEAGYAKGLKIKLMALSGGSWPSEAEAIAAFLRDIGIEVKTDLADPGRFFNMMWLQGWDDLMLFVIGIDPTFLITFHRQFGPQPMANYASLERPPELMALANKSLQLHSEEEQIDITKQLVRFMGDECLVIPLYLAPSTYLIKPYVHSTFLKESMVTRYAADEWMDPH